MPRTSQIEQLQLQLAAAIAAPLIASAIEELVDHLDSGSSSDDSDSSSSSDDSTEEEVQDILLAAMDELTRIRYLNRRGEVIKTAASMENCINHRYTDPDLFRKTARIDPATFDLLVEILKDQPIFHNESNNRQMPVERQVLITLKRFGTYGNGSSVHEIAEWAGIGQGTVDLVTRRVVTAILDSDLRRRHVRWPGDEEKEAAKEWVEAQSISAFRNGWCMVDGTTIPLFEKPHYHGESFYDRTSRYSINAQIVNTPNNLQVIDYATGFNGSCHDTLCFSYTRLAQNHDQLLSEEEWCWSDAGYPLRTWCIIPYKGPLSSVRENREFNFALSKIRIRSEHAIGYLKGRFQSLKELRIRINSPEDVTYASCWIQSCIILHAFSIDNELETNEEWLSDGVTWERDVRAAVRQQDERGEDLSSAAQTNHRYQPLRAGGLARESLKRKFLVVS